MKLFILLLLFSFSTNADCPPDVITFDQELRSLLSVERAFISQGDQSRIRFITPTTTETIVTPYMETRILGPEDSANSLVTTGLNPCVAMVITVSTPQGNAHCMAHIAPQFADTNPDRHKNDIIANLVTECEQKLGERYEQFSIVRANIHGRYSFSGDSYEDLPIHAQNLKNVHDYLQEQGFAEINVETNNDAEYRTYEFFKDSRFEIRSDFNSKDNSGGEILYTSQVI